MEFITNMRSQLAQLKLQESSIRKGLNIFKIDQPPSHIIVGLDKVGVCCAVHQIIPLTCTLKSTIDTTNHS